MGDPYANGEIYDLEYADYNEDVHFYVERTRGLHGPVLELGCGTGRLTLPMARAGATVVGIDRAPGMAVELLRRLDAEPPEVRARVEVHVADYRDSLPVNEPYRLAAWPFNALHHCEDTDQITALLRNVHARCAPNARLALDCYLPAPHLLGRDPHGRHEYRVFTHPRSGERIVSWEQDSWDDERQIHHVVYTYQPPKGEQHEVHLALHMYGLVQIRRAIARAGWRLVHEAQDFRGTKLTPAAVKWVGVGTRAP